MPNGHGYSFPMGVPLVIYPLLAIGIAGTYWWSAACTALAVLCAGVFTWEALSEKEYAKIHANDPTMNRATWRFNWLLFFALPPTALALFGIYRLLR